LTLTENSPFNIPALFTSSGENDTLSLGKKLSHRLKKGDIVALKGKLGAGKTCFTKGIAMGLGIEETITSPSYTIISEYEGRISGDPVTLYHIDVYRLDGVDDFYDIGGEEILFGKGISIIEWSERLGELIPPGAFRVDIEIMKDNTRAIRIYREN